MPMLISATPAQRDRMKNGPKTYAHLDLSTVASTPIAVLPGIAGKQIFVKSMYISFENSGIVRFEESASNSRLFNHELKDNSQSTYSLDPDEGLFLLSEGEGLDLISLAGGDMRLHVVFDYLPEA